jgi:hypothetical protein
MYVMWQVRFEQGVNDKLMGFLMNGKGARSQNELRARAA